MTSHLHHDLAPHYAALRALPHRRALLRSPLWPRLGGEIERITAAVETGGEEAAGCALGGAARVVSWNIQRGRQFAALVGALQGEATLAAADVLLLVEVDCGMARSGHRHVARELAAALGMHYAFGVSYLVLEDDWGENPDGVANQLALAGVAVLTRAPILAVENVDVPALRDKLRGREKRLGKKRALVCRIAGTPPLTVAACHLDSNASPAGRAAQLEAIVAAGLRLAEGGPLLVGGDLNTTTYDLSSPWALAHDLAHKLFVTGFDAAVAGYMTPELRYERPLFELFRRHGLAIDGFNDRRDGTLHFDLNDPYARQKCRHLVGRPLTRLLEWRLAPWKGRVPARLDWFAGRGLEARWAGTVPSTASDHAAIVVDVRW